MKIIFFGNTSFGLPTLEKLNKSDIKIMAAVTNNDVYKSRKKIIKTPIKSWAEQNSIELIQQDNLNDMNFIKNLKSLNADFFIVIAYKILPQQIFSIPKYGTMNLHGSLLPKYRGAAPIQRSILNGDKVTGISTFIIDKDIDTGNVILQKELSIGGKNFGQIHDELSKMGASLVINSINHIVQKKPLFEQQGSYTYAPKIKKDETQINWHLSSTNIINLIRAFSPTPGAFSYLNDKRVRIYEAIKSLDFECSLAPGEISILNKKKLLIGSIDSPIEIKQLQLEGKNIMDTASFINGYKNVLKNESKFKRR
tara:strand:+ start:259 stop:1188 length:930 start_codon:yes stop_codon:yes gene_type:complete